MTTKIFLLGRPGSGKSTVVPFIEQKVGNKRLVLHGGDYPILFDMYMRDNGRYFEPADPFRPDLGFNVKSPLTSPVLNIALKELETQTWQRIRDNEPLGRDELIILEFARRDHRDALKQLSPEFLAGSHFLLIEAPIQLCIDRLHKRAEDHGENFIGDEIIAGYYGIDNYPLMEDYQVSGQKVERIWNKGLSLEQLHERTNKAVETMFPSLGKEAATLQPLGLSPEQRYR